MNERRIKRLQEQIKARAAIVVQQEMADPRRGLITITRVEVDRELAHCKIYWSVLGDDKARSRNGQMLNHAAKFVQREIAAILHTRNVPKVQFVFDESIAGAIRIDEVLREIQDERESLGLDVDGNDDGDETDG